MMKKILFLLLIVATGAVLFYQNSRLLEAQKRLVELEDWAERKKIEDNLAKEMESKRRNQEFIMQMDYQVQLQDLLGSKLTAVDEELARIKNDAQAQSESRFNQLQENLNKFERKNNDQWKETQQLNEAQEQRLVELEAALTQELKASEKAQEQLQLKYLDQVKFLKQEIEKLRRKQALLSAKIDAGTSDKP